MSRGALAGVVAVALGIASGLVRLFASDLVRHKWPRLHDWLTDYRGVTLRWTVLAAVMLGAAAFVVVLALGTAEPGNRNFLWAFAGLLTASSVFFAEQGRRALRQATPEGRRRRSPRR